MRIVGLDHCLDLGEVHGAVRPVQDRLRLDRAEHREAAGLVAIAVRFHADDRLVAALAMGHERGKIRLRARREKERRLEAEDLGGARLQAVHRRVVAEHVVAELGLRGFAHAGRGSCDGVGTKVDKCAHGLDTIPARRRYS